MPPLSRRSESAPHLPLYRGGEREWMVAAAAKQALPSSRVPAKLLLNVTVQRSLGPVHVIISPDSTVADLIKAAVAAYAKEGRRPLLRAADPVGYELHYSQFILESLDSDEKLINLGSRNFFLCSKQSSTAAPTAAAAFCFPSDCRRDDGHKKGTLATAKVPGFFRKALDFKRVFSQNPFVFT